MHDVELCTCGGNCRYATGEALGFGHEHHPFRYILRAFASKEAEKAEQMCVITNQQQHIDSMDDGLQQCEDFYGRESIGHTCKRSLTSLPH